LYATKAAFSLDELGQLQLQLQLHDAHAAVANLTSVLWQ
jgi:hypothetical protein